MSAPGWNGWEAVRLSNAIGISPSSVKQLDVDIYQIATPIVFFGGSYNTTSTDELVQISITLNDLTNNITTGSLNSIPLSSQPSSSYVFGWPTLAANWDLIHPSYDDNNNTNVDEWVISVKERNFTNSTQNIVIYKGNNGGSFDRHVVTTGNLDNCVQVGSYVTYSQDRIFVVWPHDDCNSRSNLSGRDIIGEYVSWNDGTPHGHFIRLNDSNHLTGNQTHPNVHSVGQFGEIFLAYYDVQTAEVLYKRSSIQAFKNGTIERSLEETPFDQNAYPNPFEDFISVEVTAASWEKAIISLVNIKGHVILQKTIMLNKGGNRISYEADKVPPGIYLLKVNSNSVNFIERVSKL